VNRDRQWAEALIRSGDEHAFRELYRRHTPRLHQFVLRMLGGAETEAEDVVQETWVRAVSQLRSFRWQSAFATWLTGIGLNLCRENLRRRGRWQDGEGGAAAEMAAPAVPTGLRIDLEKAISLLPAGYRTVLLMHDVEGWNHREIACELGISAGTSKSQLAAARRRVRALLARETSHEGDSP